MNTISNEHGQLHVSYATYIWYHVTYVRISVQIFSPKIVQAFIHMKCVAYSFWSSVQKIIRTPIWIFQAQQLISLNLLTNLFFGKTFSEEKLYSRDA